ncbi:MAG: CDP-alcohol phosphatidyltransferase family protein [Sporolactobacillus sp.]|nr:CDP-alcohol phosphatidyltransferase family protein [Sporolactobacillus sp.]
MKSAANLISIARLVFALTLVFTEPLSAMFFILFLACGISDVLDGYVARKTGTTSKLGDNIDSVADFVMCLVLISVLYVVVNPTTSILIWLLFIIVIRILSTMIVFVKYRTFAMLHTYGNKITGLLLFVFVLALPFVQTNWLLSVVCLMANLSAIEELLINLFSAELQLNKKSLFLR